jgi:hypothetical protein
MNRVYQLSRVGLAACFLLLATAAAMAAEPMVIGKVVSAEGEVKAFDAANTSRVLALENEVSLGERIVTGPGASVKILLEDESIIAQGELSEIVLDEYVYKPHEQKGNALMRATRGVFRIITGKITELNPEEFKVRSGLATIGIRGCEVGLRIGKKDEDIYILELPKGRSIYIEREDGSGSGAMSGPGFVNVIQQGIVVSIRSGGGLTQRTFSPGEVMRVFQSLNALGSSEDTSERETKPAARHHEARAGSESIAEAGNEADLGAELDSKADESSGPVANGGGDTRGDTPQPPAILPPPSAPPEVRPPNTDPPSLVGGHPEMNDWEWGIWENGNVGYHPNRYLGAKFLGREDVGSVLNGNVSYHLNGNGQAGATIYHADAHAAKQVTGSATLSVDVGATANPTWGGTFDLNNGDGDRLAFTVDPGSGGVITPDGHLVLSPEAGLSAYTMTVNGKVFDRQSVTKQSVDGQLIKPSSLDNSISAAAGEFHFEHGADAHVDGAFGVDF